MRKNCAVCYTVTMATRRPPTRGVVDERAALQAVPENPEAPGTAARAARLKRAADDKRVRSRRVDFTDAGDIVRRLFAGEQAGMQDGENRAKELALDAPGRVKDGVIRG